MYDNIADIIQICIIHNIYKVYNECNQYLANVCAKLAYISFINVLIKWIEHDKNLRDYILLFLDQNLYRSV